MTNSTEVAALTTTSALDLIAHERAPRSTRRSVNPRVVCADGFAVSVQASRMHYAEDSGLAGEMPGGQPARAPYWREESDPVFYPFTSFEVAYPTPVEPEGWDEWEASGVWSYVPREAVAALLDSHGGAVAWEVPA